MARARLFVVLVVVLVMAGIAAALAHTLKGSSTASTTPLEAGAPTALSLATTFDTGTHGELTAVELDLARGFHFDPRAAGTCSDAEAHAGTCPRTSTIGRGKGTIVVQGRYLPRTSYQVGATFYLAKPRHHGDLAGIVFDLYETESKLHATMFGRVVALRHGSYGIAIRFSRTDTELPKGYSLTLLQLTTLLRATRTVRTSTKKGYATYYLLTNPTSCSSQGWGVQLLIQSAGQTELYHSDASCRAR